MNYKPLIDPSKIRKYYSKTLKDNIVLLTAHSHQAWPDIIEQAQLKTVNAAFKNVDQKWDYLFGEVVPKFQRLISERTGNKHPDLIANGENTHELVTRVLSCFPWDSRTKILSTDCEFHSVKRQLFRLKEEGVDVNFIPAEDKNNLTEKFIEGITPKTDLVIISSVFFNDGFVLQNVKNIISKAREAGAVFLLDAYHHFNIRKLNISELGDDIFVTAGGYKYAQAGEGAAWLKVPTNCNLRPKITGWFADFESLDAAKYPYPVNYGKGGERFLGATRDMTGIFRQIAVLEFMNETGMSVECLEENNLIQTAYLINIFDKSGLQDHAELVSSRKNEERGPFFTLKIEGKKSAHQVQHELWEKYKVLTDTRGYNLRVGPAPYTTAEEMDYCIECIGKILA